MKYGLPLITLFLFLSCHQPAKNKYKTAKDRLSVLVQDGFLHNDSAKLLQALLLSDSLLSIDTVSSDRFLLFHTKASVHAALGDIDNSINWEEKAMLMMPVDNIDRLAFCQNRLLWGGSSDLKQNVSNGKTEISLELLQAATWELVSPHEDSPLATCFLFEDGKMKEILQNKKTGEQKTITIPYYLAEFPTDTFKKEWENTQDRGKYILFEYFPRRAFYWSLLKETPEELTAVSQTGGKLILKKAEGFTSVKSK